MHLRMLVGLTDTLESLSLPELLCGFCIRLASQPSYKCHSSLELLNLYCSCIIAKYDFETGK